MMCVNSCEYFSRTVSQNGQGMNAVQIGVIARLAFILRRIERLALRHLSRVIDSGDYQQISPAYLNTASWRVKENHSVWMVQGQFRP